jgi:hypothetical protein
MTVMSKRHVEAAIFKLFSHQRGDGPVILDTENFLWSFRHPSHRPAGAVERPSAAIAFLNTFMSKRDEIVNCDKKHGRSGINNSKMPSKSHSDVTARRDAKQPDPAAEIKRSCSARLKARRTCGGSRLAPHACSADTGTIFCRSADHARA